MTQPETVQTSKHCLDEIEAWLVAHVAEAAGIAAEEVDVQETFDSFGLSSREAVTMSGDLEEWLGVRLPPTLVYQYPTVQKLAEYLATITRTGAENAVPEKRYPVHGTGAATEDTSGPEPGAVGDDREVAQAAEVEELLEMGQLTEAEAEALLLEKLAALEGKV